MSRDSEYDPKEDLAFFGRVNASISHELKNILAIISEASGLLNDLTELASTGGDVNLEMLKTCSSDIGEEIQRGFATIKQMNRFSHSVDDPMKKIDLLASLDLMSAVAGFLSYAGPVTIDSPEGDLPEIFTAPFRFQHLIYELLVFAFKSSGPDIKIKVSVQTDESDRVRIIFSSLKPLSMAAFSSELALRLAESIEAEIKAGQKRETIELNLPLSMDSEG